MIHGEAPPDLPPLPEWCLRCLGGAVSPGGAGHSLAGPPAPEHHTFAFDDTYAPFIASKAAAHRRAAWEYMGEAALGPDLREAALTHIARTLAADSGGRVTWDGRTLRNRALGWQATLNLRWNAVEDLQRFDAPDAALVHDLTPLHALDFLGLNAPEDLALIARDPASGRDWLAATHVLSPQHWDPRDKLGRDFVAVHTPVAGSGPMNATAPKLVDAVIARGPFVRFAWGISMTGRLDHHPAAPADADRAPDTTFDPDAAFLRVERQTLAGFPAAHGALFTIRPFTYPLQEAVETPAQARALATALRSMTPEQVVYKGLTQVLPGLLTWLDGRLLDCSL
ncbi:heme-dependent oxidative N-demethylase subunit alpha family protein [Deinococcus multiflagellatus]|uniref:Heme-dependent oxidative N-demethylase subunit alpha family protein n=1 Tax=Deinococcus multiflagellatus TaxID=1656887 RepID=A0ABW1ZIR6_9DEIO